MTVTRAIRDRRADLSPAERRVADLLLADPERVAFGTVAEVATAARAGGATVVRLADRLGYDGFRGLQAQVQAELSARLRPAAERIREPATDDLAGRTLANSLENLRATFAGLANHALAEVADAVADDERQVWLLAGTADRATSTLLADRLALLRDRVALIDGSPIDVARRLASVVAGDTVIAIDLRRYERWVVEAAAQAAARQARVVAITDSLLSPIARDAWQVLVVRAVSVAPFDSVVAPIALAEAIVSEVADRRRTDASARLAAIEAAWQAADALVDG
jgi:DNA-binding MurR/RpiR family transcriptional regulator